MLRSKTKRSEIQVYFFAFFAFFHLIFVSFWFFRLIFAYFTFFFASDFLCFALKWIMWNQAFFRFQAKWNFRFNFKFCFRSESEGAPYTSPAWSPPGGDSTVISSPPLCNYFCRNKVEHSKHRVEVPYSLAACNGLNVFKS